jgi:hypothetical protein
VESGTAVLALLVALVDDVRAAGRLADAARLGAAPTDVVAALGPLLADEMFARTSLDETALAQGICAWTLLLGAVSSEIFGQLGPLPDAGALFDVLLAAGRTCIITDPGEQGSPALGH